MASVQAYADLKLFGVMPRAGGTFDQEQWLLEEMRTVAQVVAQVEAQRQPKGPRARR